jgi:restriction system protein
MPVPPYESFMLPLLRAVRDGGEHNIRDVRDQLAAELRLTEAERAEMLPSGKQTFFDNRVGWAKTYLDKAGLITSVRRGVYRIIDAGKAVLAEGPKDINRVYLGRFDAFREFLAIAVMMASPRTSMLLRPPRWTPGRRLKSNSKPQFFEKLIIQLLVKMGYGGTIAGAGEALGLDAIYIQAKRWQNNVGRPEVQGFAGSLMGRRGRKGVFLTTSLFSKEARD